MTVIVGVDGSGRTHRLAAVAAASGRAVVAVNPDERPEVLIARVDAAGNVLVVADDADRLPAGLLRSVARVGRGSAVAVAISRRPAIGSPELAELDAVAAHGGVEQLAPLDSTSTAQAIRAATGRQVTAEQAEATRVATGGLPALIALAPEGRPEPGLHARVQRQLARIGPDAGRLAGVLALGVDLPDDVVAEAAGLDRSAVPQAARALEDAGLAVGGKLIPVVAAALAEGTTTLSPEICAVVGDRLRFSEPEAAAGWYDRALATGVDPERVAVGRAEAAALLGLPVDPDVTAGPDERPRLQLLLGAVAAHQGRQDRCAETLLAAEPPGPVMAVPALAGLGRVEEAERAAKGEAPASVRLFAEAVLAANDPQLAVPLLIEAAEAAEYARSELILPDTPHAVGAIVAMQAGDVATAEHLLARAKDVGGPVAATRHRLLRAWARMRAGRTDTATSVLRELARQELPGRERLLVAALTAGLARRTGDIGQLREAWTAAEPVLARQAVDLLHIEPLEELLVAAARLRRHDRVAAVLTKLDGMLTTWGRPPAWTAALGWIRLQVAVAAEDARAAATVAAELEAVGQVPERQQAQTTAAAAWAKVLADRLDADGVLAAAEGLTAVRLPWEASRLAGAAAIRTADPQTARRLLERARELASPEAPADGKAPKGTLSEREIEVSKLVLAGRTHREIGAQLYVSPKTVEHHVARIRAKLGATSRAELQAALRSLLGADD